MGIIKKQGIKNTLISYSGILIGFISLVVLQPLLLKPEELGLTRILYSFSVVVATIIPLGISNVTIRFFSLFSDRSKGHHGYFGFLILFPLLGIAVVSLLLLYFKPFFIAQYSKQSKLFADYFMYVFPLSFFIALVSVFTSYCASLFRTTFPVFLNDILIRVISLILFSCYFLKWINLDALVLLFVLIYGAQVLALLFYIFKIDTPSLKINWPFFEENNVKTLVEYGLLFSIAAIAGIGLRYVDSVIIGMYLPLASVGVYAIAALIPTVIEAPLAAIEKISNPAIGKEWENGNIAELTKVYYQSTKYLMVIGGLLFIGININIQSVQNLLPVAYRQIVDVVGIISLGSLINVSTGVNSSIIFLSKKYKAGLVMLLMLFFVTILLNVLLIPRYGLIGAALSNAIAAILYNGSKYIFLYLRYKMQPFDKNIVLVVILIISCFALNFLLPKLNNSILDIIYRSLIISFIYGIAIHSLKIIPETEEYYRKIKNRFIK
ncbi:MAG: polysaccharide biosynthesis C-terminal domain-containing protein [Bacteroidetes bacterium]|nr:polysaccharide biosynthesis C-terminal domain-containing protein [Bacteroidota bacterium]